MVWRRWGECSFIFSFDLAGCSAVLYKDWNCETQNAQMHSHKYTHTHTKVNSKRKSKINAILMLSQRHCRHQWQWDEQKQQNHGDRQTEKGTLLTWRHMMTWWMPGGMERCTLLGLSVLGRRLRWSTQCWRFECTPPRRGWDWVWRMCNVRIHRLSYTWTHNMYAICHQARDKADDFRLIPSSRCSIFACNNTVMPLQSIVPCSLNALNSVQGYTRLKASWYHPDIILTSSWYHPAHGYQSAEQPWRWLSGPWNCTGLLPSFHSQIAQAQEISGIARPASASGDHGIRHILGPSRYFPLNHGH